LARQSAGRNGGESPVSRGRVTRRTDRPAGGGVPRLRARRPMNERRTENLRRLASECGSASVQARRRHEPSRRHSASCSYRTAGICPRRLPVPACVRGFESHQRLQRPHQPRKLTMVCRRRHPAQRPCNPVHCGGGEHRRLCASGHAQNDTSAFSTASRTTLSCGYPVGSHHFMRARPARRFLARPVRLSDGLQHIRAHGAGFQQRGD